VLDVLIRTRNYGHSVDTTVNSEQPYSTKEKGRDPAPVLIRRARAAGPEHISRRRLAAFVKPWVSMYRPVTGCWTGRESLAQVRPQGVQLCLVSVRGCSRIIKAA
jgi:hypothetical protein